MALLRDDELNNYGKRYLCELYRRAQHIAGRRFDRYKIFEGLGLEAFDTEIGRHQATDEIVQDFRRRHLLNRYENNYDVSLTDPGLDRARSVCRDNPVTMSPENI